MNTTDVSVVLPTFNRARTLARAMDTVLTQSASGIELVVVDDGSTDDTATVLNEYASDRVRIAHLPDNRGPAAARNVGAKLAAGRFLAFQDSDDKWLPGRVATQLDQLRAAPAKVAVSYGHVRKVLPGGEAMLHPGRSQPHLDGRLFEDLAHGNFIGLPSVIMRREAFEDVGGFDERLRSLEDWELMLRLAHRFEFAFVPRVVVDSPISPGGVNSSAPEALRAIGLIREVHWPSFDARARSNLAYLEADALVRLKQMPEARRRLVRALRLDPSNGKAWFALGASSAGPMAYARLKALAARWKHGE